MSGMAFAHPPSLFCVQFSTRPLTRQHRDRDRGLALAVRPPVSTFDTACSPVALP